MEKTKDYSMFYKLDQNREINEANVQKLILSLQIKNLLEFRPILVNEKFQVIDGQHRLEAAKRLGIEVYYEIMKKPPADAVLLLNTNQKQWSLNDYLNYFIENKNSSYINLKKIIDDENVSVKMAMCLGGKYNTTQRYAFKKGEFEFTKEDVEKAEKVLSEVKSLKDFIKSKKFGRTLWIDTEKFKYALIKFILIPTVNLETLKSKLELRLEMLRPCVHIDTYLEILIRIYNYKNKSPISSFDVVDESEENEDILTHSL